MAPQAQREFDEQITAVALRFYFEKDGVFQGRLEICEPLSTACDATPLVGATEHSMWAYMWNQVVFGIQHEMDLADKANLDAAIQQSKGGGKGASIGKGSRHWTAPFVYSSSSNPNWQLRNKASGIPLTILKRMRQGVVAKRALKG